MVLDNQITSVATIQSAISDQGRINGLSSQQEASDLALVLKTGALPAGIKYEQERTIGPSLGADSIREGIYAAIAGLIAVIVVMLVYYKKAGINAVLALLLNTVLLMAALSYFGATLTLPGIAGVILTIGMAVDSNVLIFERIREELRSRKIDSGGCGCGLRQGLVDDRRHARHDHRFVSVPVPVRHRPGEGIRGDAGHRSARERVYGGVRVESDLRLGAFADASKSRN